MDGSRDLELIRHYKKKYCPSKKWCLFQDCCIYFSDSFTIMNVDHKAISDHTLRRMKLDAIWHGGEVSNDLSCATHLIVYSTPSSERPFDILYDRCPSAVRHLLHDRRLHVVRHQWLEDSLCKSHRLPEDAYNLRPDSLVDLKIEARAPGPEIPPAVERVEEQRHEALAFGERSRKRGRSVNVNTKKGRQVARPARRTRARTGRKPAKIHLDESEDGASSNESNRTSNAETSVLRGVQENESIKEEHGKLLGHSGHLHETLSMKGKRNQDDKDEGYPRATKDGELSTKASTLDETGFQRSDYANSAEQGSKGATEKLEIMYDPVQAMLLNMIPSLSQKGVETGKVIFEDKRESQPKTAVGDERQPEIDTKTVKKKVSYKDVASQLLGEF